MWGILDVEYDYDKVGNLSAYTDYANAHTYPNVGQLPDAPQVRPSITTGEQQPCCAKDIGPSTRFENIRPGPATPF